MGLMTADERLVARGIEMNDDGGPNLYVWIGLGLLIVVLGCLGWIVMAGSAA